MASASILIASVAAITVGFGLGPKNEPALAGGRCAQG